MTRRKLSAMRRDGSGPWLAVLILLAWLSWLGHQSWSVWVKIILFVAVLWFPATLGGDRIMSELLSLLR